MTSVVHTLSTFPVYQGALVLSISQLLRADLARGGAQWWSPAAAAAPPPAKSLISRIWFSLPQPFRFFVSGNCGNVLFFTLDRWISSGLADDTPHKDTVSFFAAYMTHIVGQHLLHAFLVYGLETIDTRAKYWRTLRGMYAALLTSAVGSTLLNAYLLQSRNLPKNQAFITTLVVFACINYVWIGRIVSSQTDVAVEPEAPRWQMRGGTTSDLTRTVILHDITSHQMPRSYW